MGRGWGRDGGALRTRACSWFWITTRLVLTLARVVLLIFAKTEFSDFDLGTKRLLGFDGTERSDLCRSGNEEKLMALLTPLNVNCHASDGRKVNEADAAGADVAALTRLEEPRWSGSLSVPLTRLALLGAAVALADPPPSSLV